LGREKPEYALWDFRGYEVAVNERCKYYFLSLEEIVGFL